MTKAAWRAVALTLAVALVGSAIATRGVVGALADKAEQRQRTIESLRVTLRGYQAALDADEALFAAYATELRDAEVEAAAYAEDAADDARLLAVSHERGESWTVTAYCACARCTGDGDGVTASGQRVRWGIVAAPASLPFGTRLRIDGLGVFVVADRGGSIQGKRLDVYFESHDEAVAFGRRTMKVTVLP